MQTAHLPIIINIMKYETFRLHLESVFALVVVIQSHTPTFLEITLIFVVMRRKFVCADGRKIVEQLADIASESNQMASFFSNV